MRVRSGSADRLSAMQDVVVAIVTVLVGAGAVGVAHRLGQRAGMHQTIPWRPIFQLVEHRSCCLAHDRTRIRRDLGPPLGIPDWAWGELSTLRRPLLRRAHRIEPP
jgi:hypothetical protein